MGSCRSSAAWVGATPAATADAAAKDVIPGAAGSLATMLACAHEYVAAAALAATLTKAAGHMTRLYVHCLRARFWCLSDATLRVIGPSHACERARRSVAGVLCTTASVDDVTSSDAIGPPWPSAAMSVCPLTCVHVCHHFAYPVQILWCQCVIFSGAQESRDLVRRRQSEVQSHVQLLAHPASRPASAEGQAGL